MAVGRLRLRLRLRFGCDRRGFRSGNGAGLAINAVERFEELELCGSERGLRRLGKFGAAEGEAANGGGDFQSARNLRQIHATQLLLPKGFEEALGGGEELLGGIPFLFTKALETMSPIGSLLALSGELVASLLLQQAGVEFLEATVPSVTAGPPFDGG